MDNMKYNPILFDLDGTLINPELGITSAVQYALAHFGINEDRAALTPFIGPPLNRSFETFYDFDEKKAMEAVKLYREYYLPKGLYESTVYRGIPELLTKLKKAKAKLYIVTFKPTFIAEKIMHYHELDTYFDGIKGVNPDLLDSDKTIMIKEILSLLPQDKNHKAIMVGDREHDIVAAHESGIDSIGATYGYGSHEEIKNAKPTYTAHTIKELDKYLTMIH
jgi:phosphoglycolate phosphatase